MFKHACISAPKRFAKFGWKTQTFCHKKVEEADKLLPNLNQTRAQH